MSWEVVAQILSLCSHGEELGSLGPQLPVQCVCCGCFVRKASVGDSIALINKLGLRLRVVTPSSSS